MPSVGTQRKGQEGQQKGNFWGRHHEVDSASQNRLGILLHGTDANFTTLIGASSRGSSLSYL